MIMSSCKRNRNALFGKIAARGRNGRETADGTKGIVERESGGTGEAGTTGDTDRSKRTESGLSAGAADICRIRSGSGAVISVMENTTVEGVLLKDREQLQAVLLPFP
jgi:hypothetical protein